MTKQTVTVQPLPVATWAELPPMARREAKLLDERELCPLVNAFAHDERTPSDAEVFACYSWAAGSCRRAGTFVSCAFHDPHFQWEKARDWQRQSDGGMLYAPQKRNGNGRK